MEVPIILIDGLPVSDEVLERLILEKLLNTENGKRVLLDTKETSDENVP